MSETTTTPQKKPKIIREIPPRPESFRITEGLMMRTMDPNREVRMRARLIVEAWNPWRTLPIIVMPADEFDAILEKQKYLHFGSGCK